MKLTDLEPRFIRAKRMPAAGDEKTERWYWAKEYVATLADADGVMFWCPVCFEKNKGPAGTHKIICWQPQVDDEVPAGKQISPIGGRWTMRGTDASDLTLDASVQIGEPCNTHFYVRSGEVDVL